VAQFCERKTPPSQNRRGWGTRKIKNALPETWATRRSQVVRLRELRARRDAAKAQAGINEVERRARSGENLMPAILAAVEARATVGEISDALRRAFGEYQESVVV
jgi:methylmalonyl-CoA mutase N-terminal domain/subunit